MPKITRPAEAFDKLVEKHDYFKTVTSEALIERIQSAPDGYHIYLFMSAGKSHHNAAYRHYNLSPEAQEIAEKSGWTGGCFALAKHLGKPRSTNLNWHEHLKTQEHFSTYPHINQVRETCLKRLKENNQLGGHLSEETAKSAYRLFGYKKLQEILLTPDASSGTIEWLNIAASEHLKTVARTRAAAH